MYTCRCSFLHWKWSLHDIMHVSYVYMYTCISEGYYGTVVEFWAANGICWGHAIGLSVVHTVHVPVQIIWWCWVVSWSVCSRETWPASAVHPHSPPPPHPCTHHPTHNTTQHTVSGRQTEHMYIVCMVWVSLWPSWYMNKHVHSTLATQEFEERQKTERNPPHYN